MTKRPLLSKPSPWHLTKEENTIHPLRTQSAAYPAVTSLNVQSGHPRASFSPAKALSSTGLGDFREHLANRKVNGRHVSDTILYGPTQVPRCPREPTPLVGSQGRLSSQAPSPDSVRSTRRNRVRRHSESAANFAPPFYLPPAFLNAGFIKVLCRLDHDPTSLFKVRASRAVQYDSECTASWPCLTK